MLDRKIIYLSILCVGLAIAYFGWKFTARGAYESPQYTVLESDGAFETREYPPLMLATTKMSFASQADDGSFMRLFRYISGANDIEQKVAMTTPVFMESEDSETPGQMGFIIPSKTVEQGIPSPRDRDVRIQKRQGGRFAVFRFAGRTDGEVFAEAEEKLRTWMADRGLAGEDDAEFAGYDAPWTPGPLRRNEVLIRLRPAEATPVRD